MEVTRLCGSGSSGVSEVPINVSARAAVSNGLTGAGGPTYKMAYTHCVGSRP